MNRQAARELVVAKRLREIKAVKSAELVRAELLSAIEEDRPFSLSPGVITRARQARPIGEFPSHRTLMMIFENVL